MYPQLELLVLHGRNNACRDNCRDDTARVLEPNPEPSDPNHVRDFGQDGALI